MNWIQKTLSYLNLQYFTNNTDDYNSYIIVNGTKPTEQELNLEYKNVLKIECKNEAKKKISACDWSVLQDVKLLNQTEFINYRVILRDYILNPTENPDFPPEPNPIWAI